MANESIIAVPPNINEPIVLQRFLTRLVEQLDIVLGNRAGPNKQYTSQEQLLIESDKLSKLLEDASNSLEAAIQQVDSLSNEAILTLTERIIIIEAKDVEQDNRLDAIETLNATQNSRLDVLEAAGYITDAPSDGNTYGRKDGAWVIIP